MKVPRPDRPATTNICTSDAAKLAHAELPNTGFRGVGSSKLSNHSSMALSGVSASPGRFATVPWSACRLRRLARQAVAVKPATASAGLEEQRAEALLTLPLLGFGRPRAAGARVAEGSLTWIPGALGQGSIAGH